ncbi:MAG: transporter, partial [Melioribacteraceae bacterium]|nr:transporter [Melioribacteraceae bacterium]
GVYVRTIDFFGLSGKIDMIVPYAGGDWAGILEGTDTSTVRTGLGDPRFRISFNFIGSPALTLSEFKNYKQTTVFGAALQIIAPLGQYDPTKLINLGSNRWTFRPQIGFSRTFDQLIVEAYISGWFFTVNPNFYNNNELKQNPLLAGKVHLIYTLKNKMWFSFDAGYGIGGRTFVNDEKRDTRISTLRFGLDWSVPFAEQHTLKLSYISGVRLERGPDFDAFTLIYQYRWGGS